MLKKLTVMLCSLLLVGSMLSQFAMASGMFGSLDYSMLNKGTVGYSLSADSGKKYKLAIQKQGVTYYYNITSGVQDYFPLQTGNGDYTVKLLENVSGSQYRVVQSNVVTLAVAQSQDAFLGSVQNIEWSYEDAAIQKAAELTKDLSTDREKIQAIYNYIITNVTYDRTKARTVTSQYIPEINSTFSTNKGICYDYASLFAAMLRSVNIPAKLVMGSCSLTNGQYHAWNEVYCTDTGSWLVIDTTSDASLRAASKNYDMVKDAGQYTASKVY